MTRRPAIHRIAIIALLVVALGFVALMLSVPLLIRDPLPVAAPGRPTELEAADAGSSVELTVDRTRRFTLALRLPAGGSPPEVLLYVPDHDMEPVAPEVVARSSTDFVATGTLPMPGRWRVVVRSAGGEAHIDVIVQE